MFTMQSYAHASSSDEVDAETLEALLLHLSPDRCGTNIAHTTASAANPSEGSTGATQGDGPADKPISEVLAGAPGNPSISPTPHSAHDTAVVDDHAIPDYALPDAQYLERTVLSLLLRGLEEVAVVRPPDPVAFLGAYLISNNPQKPLAGSTAAFVGVAPAQSTSGSATPDGAREAKETIAGPTSFLPSQRPALAEAVEKAVERFAPPVKGVNAPRTTTSAAT